MAVSMIEIPIKTGAASVVPAHLSKIAGDGHLFVGSETGKAKQRLGIHHERSLRQKLIQETLEKAIDSSNSVLTYVSGFRRANRIVLNACFQFNPSSRRIER